MTKTSDKTHRLASLRTRAVARLTAPGAESRIRVDPSAALGVLYELASSPSTAPSALALLHELQVHQVEVDLQDEELRRSRVELETSLNRQIQLYDYAPVGYFTVDSEAVLRELNLTGASLLGFDRDFLRGRLLHGFLTPESVRTLSGMLGGVTEGAAAEFAELHLLRQSGGPRRVHASARLDPGGEGFLIALIEVAEAKSASES
jgi:PAS domain-containing protein